MLRTQIAVIGAGAVGAAVAYRLASDGRDVLLLDRGQVGHGASAGSACMITSSHAERMANPSALLEGIRYLPHPASPLAIRPRPSALGWLARFSAASLRRGAAADGSGLLVRLATRSLALHRAWSRTLDLGLAEHGYLNVYLTPEGLERGRRTAAHLLELGVPHRELSPAELAAKEPAVRGAVGAIHHPEDAHVDSLRFTQDVAAAAGRAGARVLEGAEVYRLRREADAIHLDTALGEVVADHVVVAAGVGSAAFDRALGVALPITAARGYYVERASAEPLLETPVFLAEARTVATPLAGRTRLAGTLEIGASDAVDMRRIAAVDEAGLAHVAGLDQHPRSGVWHGPRPMSADGMPLIGPLPADRRVHLATGHGMLGITLAPVTAELVAEAIGGGSADAIDPALRPDRFRRAPRLRR